MTIAFENVTEQFESVREYVQKAPAGFEILSACLDLADFLAEKNISYGNSAIKPARIFSKASNKEQLFIRIDDKLNRLFQGKEYPGDDVLKDLAGYYILLMVIEMLDEQETS